MTAGTGALPLWQHSAQMVLTGCGRQELLERPLQGFLASRQCPGAAIRAAMDWAIQQAASQQTVVSGFHSPLEQSVLAVLLQARCPVVVVLARPVEGARLPPPWRAVLADGRMAVVSEVERGARLTEGLAAARNQLVGRLATDLVLAHAAPGGQLAHLSEQWRGQGRSLFVLG
ncbi:MAG: DNA-processing protein DprA [Burkholderiaceae bacterium]